METAIAHSHRPQTPTWAENVSVESPRTSAENARWSVPDVCRTESLPVFPDGRSRFPPTRPLDPGAVAGTGATTIDMTEVLWKAIKEGATPAKEIAEVLKGS